MNLKLLAAACLASGIASAATPVDGWYTSVFGGYTYLSDNLNVYTPTNYLNHIAYNDGYNVGGRLGFQSNPIRYELEYTYLHARTDYYHRDTIRQTDVTGNSYGSLGMANLYYDVPQFIPLVSPFLGVGIGYASLSTGLSSAGPTSIHYFKIKEDVFAYQATAGLTFNFSENYALNIAYRYVATSKSGNFGKAFQANNASVGAIYRFDVASYK